MDSIAAMLKKIDHNLLHRKGFKLYLKKNDILNIRSITDAINFLKECKKVNF